MVLILEAFGRKYIFSGDVQKKNNNTDENQRSAASTDLDGGGGCTELYIRWDD